jgi:D-glycero-D-manno-heptose 1,7-bisphosphate phosphatase
LSNLAVFLDRDGVINDNRKPVNKPEDLLIYPWTASAIQQLNEAGYLVFVVTNQGGIELGYFTVKDLEAIHSSLQIGLEKNNAFINEIAYCPHFHQPCECRKPKPGMILNLANKYHVDLKSSWMIGDREPDILAGASAGCHTIKLGQRDVKADYYSKNLGEAVTCIFSNPITRQCL